MSCSLRIEITFGGTKKDEMKINISNCKLTRVKVLFGKSAYMLVRYFVFFIINYTGLAHYRRNPYSLEATPARGVDKNYYYKRRCAIPITKSAKPNEEENTWCNKDALSPAADSSAGASSDSGQGPSSHAETHSSSTN